MDLPGEILLHLLENQNVNVKVTFPGLEAGPEASAEAAALEALGAIRDILRNGALDDAECFARIEEIVRTLEDLGLGCGSRHDFG